MSWRQRSRRLALLVCLIPTSFSLADGLADFTLTKAVPADAVIAIHSRGHDGLKFLNEQGARVWQAVKDSRLDQDIRRLVKQMAINNGVAEADFEAHWAKFVELCEGVDWSTLGEREYAFAMRMSFPISELASIMKPPADAVERDFKGLTAILTTLTELAPPGQLVLSEDDSLPDTQIRRLSMAGGMPLVITVARHKDTLVFSLGSSMAEQVISMLRGEAGAALTSTPRFQEAIKRVEAPKDSLHYIDIAGLLQQVRGIMNSVQEMVTAQNQSSPEAVDEITQTFAIAGKVLNALDMFEYSVGSSTTDGKKTTTDMSTVLKTAASQSPLYPALFGNGPIKEPLKYIPVNAQDMAVNSGLDFLALYKAILTFVRDEIPHGAEHLQEWDKVQAEIGLNVETDLLGWIEGAMSTFTVPGRTPYSPGEFVWMVRVRDEAKAREMLGRAWELVEAPLAANSGAITDADVPGTEGFRSIVHPMLGLVGMSAPTIGVHDGWLMLGSSPKVLTSAIEVAAGKAENFSKNERFIAEGLKPQDNVLSLSFSDLTQLGEQISAGLNMLGMLGMMPEVAREPALQSLIAMAGKVATIAKKLDFFQSTCSQTTRDGSVLKTRIVVNYREPPKPKAAPVGEEAPGESSSAKPE